MNLGENIKYLRTQKGLSQDFIADKLGYKSFTTIQKWESGVSEPPITKLKELATILNTDIDDLANKDLTRPYTQQLKQRDEKDIAKRLEETLEDLESSQNSLMFSGEPLDDETRELLKASLENSIRIAKINAKQKFTPKKYRKDY